MRVEVVTRRLQKIDEIHPLNRIVRKALKEPYPEARVAAAEALGNIGPNAKSAVPALVEALRDSDARVRKAAEIALDTIEL